MQPDLEVFLTFCSIWVHIEFLKEFVRGQGDPHRTVPALKQRIRDEIEVDVVPVMLSGPAARVKTLTFLLRISIMTNQTIFSIL